MCTAHDSLILRLFDTEIMPKNGTPKKKRRHARFNIVLFEQSHMCTRIGGMGRRNERASCVDPSCCAQRTRPDVHHTLARVPTVCQSTADYNDNDARGRDHETHVQVHMPRDGNAIKAGNACPKACTTNACALPDQKISRTKCSPSPAHAT